MVDITQVDHVTDGLALLPAQWDESPVFRGVIRSYLESLNLVEQDIFDVRSAFNIKSAVNNQLDIIGGFFSVRRLGRDDETYREAILAKISSSSGSGTPDDLLNLLNAILEDDDSRIWEHFPYGVMLSVENDTRLSVTSTLQQAAAAGIEVFGVIFTEETSFIAKEGETAVALLETNSLDTVEVDDGSVYDLEVEYSTEEETLVFTSQFVDSSQDASAISSGWGLNWGNNWGGQSPPTYVPLADMVDFSNDASTTSSTFLPWAQLSEFDPITGTVNKIKPKLQFQNSGIKAKQPLARQYFNWMMANISDWLGFTDGQMAVGTIFQTTNSPLADIPAAEAELGTRIGGTWDYLGTDSLGTLVTVYVFERTA